MLAYHGQGVPVLILKEGSTRAKGREAMYNNIKAAKLVADMLRSSLGPRGMDKMLVDSIGDVTITNDGVTILKKMDIEHPAAKILVEVAKVQDAEVGDGTTSVVVLAGKLLENAEGLMDKGLHPSIIVEGYKKACEKAVEFLYDIAVDIDVNDVNKLKKVALTSMRSKLVSGYSDMLAEIAVKAVLSVKRDVSGKVVIDLDDIKVEKKHGGSIKDTTLINGIVLDKEVVHPAMPKRIENAKIALLNMPLEIKKTEFDARIRIDNPEMLSAFLREEREMLKEMVDKIISIGANVVFCQKGIDDIAQFYLAKAGVLAVRRVKQSDMDKLSKATGARIISNLEDLTETDLGEAKLVEERKIGDDKMVFIEGCKDPRSVSILVRGGGERIIDEVERSIHDALCVVRDVLIKPKIVVGGGAIEVELALRVRDWSSTLPSREQLAAVKFAEALEVIPLTLAENAGLDTIDIATELRSKHKQGMIWYGINLFNGKVADMMKEEIIEPAIVKEQMIKAATEASCMILRIDDIISASRLKTKERESGPRYPGLS